MENSKPKAIVRVHYPDLTDEEQAKRIAQVKRAAVELVLATERVKAAKERT